MQLCSPTSLTTAPEAWDVLQNKQLRLSIKLVHGFGGAPSGQERRWVENVTSAKSCRRAQGAYAELGVWKTNIA